MINIRLANINDSKGRGFVHYHSWNETYSGLIDQEYLDKRSLSKCIDSAMKYPDNTFVAEVDGSIVGFACYAKYRDDDLNNAGEITAIYLLKQYQGLGIGRKLLNACFEVLSDYSSIVIWVLSANKKTIGFYKHFGFKADGMEKERKLSATTTINVIRMIKLL